ncbi:hypothetical protein [Rhizobium sp. CECT 9324]|uniref:hypothetical protein n=1 Tax=Rhizobium sp. CECT 9324 TaxID=2845820 RepID=UPI001E31E5C5|nr:hypothetical protein [Rhizobium sp. CECT 9324]
MGHAWNLLPDLPEFPDDSDGWRNVGTEILHLAYSLKSAHEAEQAAQRFLSNELGGEEAFDSLPPVCWRMGHKALLASKSIRLRYGFPEGAADTWASIDDLKPTHGKGDGWYLFPSFRITSWVHASRKTLLSP